MNLLLKLLQPLGVIGIAAFWAVMILLFFAPMMVMEVSFFTRCVFMFILFLPIVGLLTRPILYIVALFYLEDADPTAVTLFWISFVVYIVTEFIPLFVSLISAARSKSVGDIE